MHAVDTGDASATRWRVYLRSGVAATVQAVVVGAPLRSTARRRALDYLDGIATVVAVERADAVEAGTRPTAGA